MPYNDPGHGQQTCSGPYWYHQDGLPRYHRGLPGAIDGSEPYTESPVRFVKDARGGPKVKALEYEAALPKRVPIWAWRLGKMYSAEGAITVAKHCTTGHTRDHQTCEVLQDSPTKFFVDIDYEVADKGEWQSILSGQTLPGLLADLSNAVRAVVSELFRMQFPRALEPVVLTCHRPGKISLHAIYNEVVLLNPQYVSAFYDEVKSRMTHACKDWLDDCVYHPGRIFRCYLQSKPGPYRPLIWAAGPKNLDDVQKFLISTLQCGMRFTEKHLSMDPRHCAVIDSLPLVSVVLGETAWGNSLHSRAVSKISGHNRVEEIAEKYQDAYDYAKQWIIEKHGNGVIIKSGIEFYGDKTQDYPDGMEFITFQIIPGVCKCEFIKRPHRSNTTWIKFKISTKEAMYKCMDSGCGQRLYNRQYIKLPDVASQRNVGGRQLCKRPKKSAFD